MRDSAEKTRVGRVMRPLVPCLYIFLESKPCLTYSFVNTTGPFSSKRTLAVSFPFSRIRSLYLTNDGVLSSTAASVGSKLEQDRRSVAVMLSGESILRVLVNINRLNGVSNLQTAGFGERLSRTPRGKLSPDHLYARSVWTQTSGSRLAPRQRRRFPRAVPALVGQGP